MNKPDVKELLNRLYQVTGFRISIHDGNGHEWMAAPEPPLAFCQCLQQNPDARCMCQASDHSAFQRASETGTLTVYRCPFGLYEAVYPLYRYGAPAGYLMMGQVPEAGNGMEEALRRSVGYGNPNNLREALMALPGYTRDRIEAFSEILAVFAEYMTLTGAIKSPVGDTASEVREYLTTHFDEPITIAHLCAHFASSRTALLNGYRQRYCETVGQTLIRIRLTKAHDYLIRTNLPIREIATRCGYTDPGYFAKAYRKYYGTAPAQERHEHHS